MDSKATVGRSGNSHYEDDVPKLPRALLVDPSDQNSNDKDDIVSASRDEAKKSVEIIFISFDSDPERDRKPSSQYERRGRSRGDGRNLRIHEGS